MLNTLQAVGLISGLIALVGSFVTYQMNRRRLAISLLIIGAFLIRLVMISLEGFLARWDEQYHALVAKNMMESPFVPMLYTDDFVFGNSLFWSNTTIWLHKQPLFLWQMVVSMKLFGVNTMAVRLPSALMGAIQCLFVYRMGKHLVHDRVGYYAAFLWATAFFHLQQVSGWFGIDHNDVAFLFYLTGSLWAWTEYWSGKRHYWVWIGVFAGCAILNKWLTGLLVYSGWGVALLADAERRQQIMYYLDGIKALGVTILVFMPWQLYISYRFPIQSAEEYAYNTKHIFEVVEEKSGGIWFYFERWYAYYGTGAVILTCLGIFVILMYVKKRSLLIGLATHLIVPLAFFSFVVVTKMPGYGYIIASLVYLLFGAVVFGVEEQLRERLPKQTLGLTAAWLLILTIFNFRYGEIELLRIEQYNDYRQAGVHNVLEYKRLDSLLTEPHIVFNLSWADGPQMRFFSKHLGYEGVYMPEGTFDKIYAAGIPMVVLRWEGGQVLPPEVIQKYDMKVIDVNLKEYRL